MANEEALRSEIAFLRAENEKLREFNTLLQRQRKEYLDELCGPADQFAPTEEQVIEDMKNAIPFSQIMAELGIPRIERP